MVRHFEFGAGQNWHKKEGWNLEQGTGRQNKQLVKIFHLSPESLSPGVVV
jgi:hypothetical protein